MDSNLNHEYLFAIDREHANDLDTGKVHEKLRLSLQKRGVSLSPESKAEVLGKGRRWLLADDRREEYLLVLEDEREQRRLGVYRCRKLFRRLLPYFYLDERYVDPCTWQLLQTICNIMEDAQAEMRNAFYNRFYPTSQNLWTLAAHQKLWDILEIMPEQEIFHRWLLEKGKDFLPKRVYEVHAYLADLCIERIEGMIKMLGDGCGTRKAIKRAFMAFFHYYDPLEDVGNHEEMYDPDTSRTSITYRLELRNRDKGNTVELTISEPLYEDKPPHYNESKFDTSRFDSDLGDPIPGFELYIHSNFDSFSLLPHGRGIEEIYGELTECASKVNQEKGKDYFEKLVSLVKAAGVESRIYYTFPILPHDGSKYHHITPISPQIEVDVLLPVVVHCLGWLSGRFDIHQFDEGLWGGEIFSMQITQFVASEGKSPLEAGETSWDIALAWAASCCAPNTEPAIVQMEMDQLVPATSILTWQESKFGNACFDQAQWASAELEWKIYPDRFDQSHFDEAIWASKRFSPSK